MLDKTTEPQHDPYARAKPSTPLRRMGEELLLATTLLTRIPVPRFTVQTKADLGSAFWAYPLVGAGVGAVGALAFAACVALGLSALPAVVAALVAMTFATGAFHEDGLADFADGVGGGLTRDKKLTIMRDSRLGTYGSVALIGYLLLSATLLVEIASSSWQPQFGGMAAVFICVGALQRAAIGIPLALLQPARSDGLAFETPAPRIRIVGLAFAIAAVLSLIGLGPGAAASTLAATIMAALGVTWMSQRYLGGRTGDALGTSASIAAIAVLFALAVIAKSHGAP
ncbi:MAG: adenosylcobinamide-GDP ribazoletransferase [Alphaproteobacteria bacterium]|nr:adenosylcobinamide-GDP ribazoletransferase [Alphaproteobacteria bacterium]